MFTRLCGLTVDIRPSGDSKELSISRIIVWTCVLAGTICMACELPCDAISAPWESPREWVARDHSTFGPSLDLPSARIARDLWALGAVSIFCPPPTLCPALGDRLRCVGVWDFRVGLLLMQLFNRNAMLRAVTVTR